MRGFSMMSDEERQQIKQQHSKLYDGYAIGNVPSNMTPLTVYDAAQDKEGVTVTANGEVKTYRNHNINEIAAKNLHYDEIDAAYDFDSQGPNDSNIGYSVYNGTKPPYEFDSRGPVDSYGGGLYDTTATNYEPKIDDEDLNGIDDEKIDNVKEDIKESLDMFKRFQKYN